MKKCSYCGRENADEALNCHECGTVFERVVENTESADGKLQGEEKTQTIRIFASHEAAEQAVAKLEAHGIKSWVGADDCGGMYPNLTTAAGVRLHVLAEDVEVAVAVLEAKLSPAEIKQIEVEAVLSTPPKTAPLKKLAPGQMIFGIVIGIILCLLYQGSEKIGTKTFNYHTAEGKVYLAYEYRDGNLVKTTKDRNLDGKADAWFYYKKGNVVRGEYDENFDGKPDVFVSYSNDLPITAEADNDFNGVPDAFSRYQNGIVKQKDYRPNRAKFTTTREFFKNGVLTEIWRGGDSNGNFSEKIRFDPFFNPISTNTNTAFQLQSPLSK